MKSTRVLLWVLISALSLFSAAAILNSCSSGGGGNDGSGTVAVYATGGSSLNSLVTSTATGTGDTALNSDLTSTATGTGLDSGGTSTAEGDGTGDHSLFSGLTLTITRIELVNKGTGTSCTVLDDHVSLGIADLSNVMHLISEADCPAASYNRVHIVFERDFLVEDKGGHESLCSLTSSNKGMGDKPDVLQCSGSFCTLDINGAVNVLAKQRNSVSLNLNLKEFEVSGLGGQGTCTVTVRTSPICASGSEGETEGLPESITGLVSHVSTSSQTFDLTRGHKTFTVLYSEITPSQQPGVDEVLQCAQDEALRLNVLSSGTNTTDGAIIASSLSMKVEGVVSNLDAENDTCTVTYKGGRTMDIAYQASSNESALKNGAWVQFKVTGYNGDRYIASLIGAGDGASMTDN